MKDTTQQPFPFGHGSVTMTTHRGREVRIRHIEAADNVLLVNLFHHLSPETRRLRFMTSRPSAPDELIWQEATRLSSIDPYVQAALVGIGCDTEAEYAVGVARMIGNPANPQEAEFALVVRDDYQREGIGSRLFDLLLQVALVRGLKRLTGLTYAENEGIHRLVRRAGLPFTSETSRGETEIVILLSDDA